MIVPLAIIHSIFDTEQIHLENNKTKFVIGNETLFIRSQLRYFHIDQGNNLFFKPDELNELTRTAFAKFLKTDDVLFEITNTPECNVGGGDYITIELTSIRFYECKIMQNKLATIYFSFVN